ncbi:MAG: hypothetical protein H6772_01085 [Pseudomonadales bacterium]|nr:hypothetical protein [Pseudomonadales bacterium]
MKNNHTKSSSGHILITLLIVMVVGMIISTAAISWVIDNTIGNSQTHQGLTALTAAESGIENAMLLLLRNPDYSGEVLEIADATVTVTVSGSDEKTIISQSIENNYSRKIEVTATYINNILTITSWKESI